MRSAVGERPQHRSRSEDREGEPGAFGQTRPKCLMRPALLQHPGVCETHRVDGAPEGSKMTLLGPAASRSGWRVLRETRRGFCDVAVHRPFAQPSDFIGLPVSPGHYRKGIPGGAPFRVRHAVCRSSEHHPIATLLGFVEGRGTAAPGAGPLLNSLPQNPGTHMAIQVAVPTSQGAEGGLLPPVGVGELDGEIVVQPQKRPSHPGSDLLAFLTHHQGPRIQRAKAPRFRADREEFPSTWPPQPSKRSGKGEHRENAFPPWRLGVLAMFMKSMETFQTSGPAAQPGLPERI